MFERSRESHHIHVIIVEPVNPKGAFSFCSTGLKNGNKMKCADSEIQVFVKLLVELVKILFKLSFFVVYLGLKETQRKRKVRMTSSKVTELQACPGPLLLRKKKHKSYSLELSFLFLNHIKHSWDEIIYVNKDYSKTPIKLRQNVVFANTN